MKSEENDVSQQELPLDGDLWMISKHPEMMEAEGISSGKCHGPKASWLDEPDGPPASIRGCSSYVWMSAEMAGAVTHQGKGGGIVAYLRCVNFRCLELPPDEF